MRPIIAPLLACLTLAGCAGTASVPPLTSKQISNLDEALAGKVPGEKQSCIDNRQYNSMRVISNQVVLYRVSRTLVYRNDLIGSCNGLTRGDTPVIITMGSQYCRGDLVRTVDMVSGIPSGSCALGNFIPYRTSPQ